MKANFYWICDDSLRLFKRRACSLFMKEQYHFCFVFNKILLLDDIEKQLNQHTRFKFELIKRNRLLGKTNDIQAYPFINKELTVENHFIRLRIEEKELTGKEICEIRLIQMQEENERLIGCYEFVLNNYVTAYNQLNRSCIELSVEIGENFTIQYEVFLQRTTQALKRIIDEHSAAKKLSTNDSNEQDEDFYFPQESTFSNGIQQSKILRLNSEGVNNIPHSQKTNFQKYQKLPSFSRQKSKIDNFSSTFAVCEKPLIPSDKRLHKIKLSRAQTSAVETQPEQKSSQFANSQTMQHVTQEEVQSNMERQEDDKNLQELYMIIQKESKVYLPGQNDNYDLYKPVKMQSPRTHIYTRENLNQICKKSDPIRNIKQVVLVVFMLLFAGLLLSNVMQPTRRAKPRRSVKH